MVRSALCAVASLVLLAGVAVSREPSAPDFNGEVQPILRRHCFRCHGETSSEGGLQLNVREAVIRGEADSGEPIVVPHHAAESLLVKRLVDSELGDQMPLDGEPLSPGETEVIRSWIDQGARWPDSPPVTPRAVSEMEASGHWAYQSVVRPSVPEGSGGNSVIDRFLSVRLKQRGLDFSPPLDRPQWIRRVSLALIGLPPTPEQVRQFLEDDSVDAHRRVVDGLLQSPHYGERWAVPWRGSPRYADSNGFQADQLRDNWAYRDWVIRAFNDDMPFDQFVIDQIAGDLRDKATVDQRIATGFHRMTTCNVEAGVDPEANRVNQVVDRVNTTATVFLGTTLECAQCHDHKYDPFTQNDYYRFFAYFNNTPLEVKNTSGVTWDFYGPTMELPMDDKRQRRPDTTLVMQELEAPRETFVMIRGDYETLGERVQPGTPPVLPHLSTTSISQDRYGLALWLTSRDNPLLARVTVNRWWAQLFGTGIVSTPEDFGLQGEPPTHPELLDWLASELMDSGWSMKHLHKLMVMSYAFGQSSSVTAELIQVDPDNRWFARGPRFRMAAELVRDNALAISGLLSESLYGPPIMPYQPDNFWRSIGRNQPVWKAAENEDRFRRGLYVVWKRAAPYPSFVNFDAPDRGSCTVQRGRSNTPLQALTLLNDPAYAEMSLALADRILSESPSSDDEARINYAMRLAVARTPAAVEIAILRELLESERAVLRSDRSLVQARTRVPFAAMPLRSDRDMELAAWFAVANTLLNLDETISH